MAAAPRPTSSQAIHDNLINQKSYVVTNPGFYNPNAAEPPPSLTSLGLLDSHLPLRRSRTSTPRSTCRPASASIAKSAKHITSNVTYLYTQGDHQYLTNNVTAPIFDDADYTVTGPTPALTTTSSSPAVFTARISSSSPQPCSSSTSR